MALRQIRYAVDDDELDMLVDDEAAAAVASPALEWSSSPVAMRGATAAYPSPGSSSASGSSPGEPSARASSSAESPEQLGSPRPHLPVAPQASRPPLAHPEHAAGPEADSAAGPELPQAAARMVRRRLSGKQPAPQGFAAAPAAPGSAADAGVPSAPAEAAARERLAHVPQYAAVVEALRGLVHARLKAENAVNGQSVGARDLRARARKNFAMMHLDARIELVETWVNRGEVPPALRSSASIYLKNLQCRLRQERARELPGGKRAFKCRGGALLLTIAPAALRAPCSVPSALQGAAIEALTRWILQRAETQALCEKIQRWVENLAKQVVIGKWAWTLEICPRLWTQKHEVALHLHVALVRYPPFDHNLSVFAYDGKLPFVSSSNPADRNKKGSAAATLFYCSIPKVGKVTGCYSHDPFKDYHVNPEWITNLLQAEKVSASSAHALYLRAKKNLDHHIRNLKILAEEERMAALADRIALVQQTVQMQMRAFKVIPAVVDRWLPCFAHIRARYPFLVLEGPSGTGKTSYAKNITGNPAEVLEVNCAATPEPDLREFDSVVHKAILFDEASAAMVLSQRKLFQAPACLIDLGCSTTNCHKYQVFVSGVMMIVCSNTWSVQVHKLKHEGDAEWLRHNSVVVHVHAPLFCDE